MKIIGCDFHPSYQQIAMVNTETGELWEGRLEHEQGEARRFYQALQGQTVRVGIEAVGNSQWFEQMLAELGHELWIGDAAQMRRRCGGWWCGNRRRTVAMPSIFWIC
jgi:transposase